MGEEEECIDINTDVEDNITVKSVQKQGAASSSTKILSLVILCHGVACT